jgi:hypothetical protein
VQILQSLKHVVGAGSLTEEGEQRYDSTRKLYTYHDGVRERSSSQVSWMPYAHAIGVASYFGATVGYSLGVDRAVLIPVAINGHMLLDSYTIRCTNTGGARGPLRFTLYEALGDGSGMLRHIEGTFAGIAGFTPGSASNRTSDVVEDAPAFLIPGIYWCLITTRNNATNFGTANTNAMAPNTFISSPSTIADGDWLLDLDPSTWVKETQIFTGLRLNGRVFGDTVAY